MRLFYKSEKQFIMKQSKLFSLPLLASLLSFSLQAQTPTDNIFYNLDERTKTAEVTNSADKYSGDISIPEKIILKETEYTVTRIGKEAFKDCTSLTNIILPNSITKIDEAAFSGCTSLLNVTIPSSVTVLGYNAFQNCTALTECLLPNSVTQIGNYPFYGCISLTTPVYNNKFFAYLPTTYEGEYNIPEGIETIVGGAFRLCTSLTSVKLPKSLSYIGNQSFRQCSALTTVTIMSNVIDNIGTLAFNNCSALNTIYIYTETLPTKTAADAFSNVPVTEVILYVPSGMASTYQGADVWKNFGSIIDTPTSIDDIKISDKPWATIVDGGIYIQAEQWEIYNFNGTLLKKGHQPQTVTLQTGLYIIHNLKKGLQKVWIK